MILHIYLISPDKTPKTCDQCGQVCGEENAVLEKLATTDSMIVMAANAGIFHAIWHPNALQNFERYGVVVADDVAKDLMSGWDVMKREPDKFKALGAYNVFLGFIEEYIRACQKYPYALVESTYRRKED